MGKYIIWNKKLKQVNKFQTKEFDGSCILYIPIFTYVSDAELLLKSRTTESNKDDYEIRPFTMEMN